MSKHVLGNVKPGLLFILSAPAGTGKTTLVNMLIHEFSCVVASISCTTRSPRPGEIHGVHYYFLSEEEFVKKVEKNEFLEYVQLYDCYYGTSRLWTEDQLALGKHVVLVIDTQGASKVRGLLPGASIFVQPPSFEELERRLISRNTESQENLEKRLLWAKEEMKCSGNYDYCIINDDLAVAYQILRSIFIAEEHRLR